MSIRSRIVLSSRDVEATRYGDLAPSARYGRAHSVAGGAPAWERSFPKCAALGSDWVLDVLDDLSAYADDRQLTAFAARLAGVRAEIRSLLRF
ncbi:MAG: hypothetical protein KDK12_03940 [Rhodobacteraceae bacterium]|nr:hypothetical protein [Paracoccaceae bacterium]